MSSSRVRMPAPAKCAAIALPMTPAPSTAAFRIGTLISASVALADACENLDFSAISVPGTRAGCCRRASLAALASQLGRAQSEHGDVGCSFGQAGLLEIGQVR